MGSIVCNLLCLAGARDAGNGHYKPSNWWLPLRESPGSFPHSLPIAAAKG